MTIFKKSPELHHFKSDRGEIWQDCSSSKYALIDVMYFQDGGNDVRPPLAAERSVAGMTSLARSLHVLQFLIHSTFVFAGFFDLFSRLITRLIFKLK